MRDTIQQEEGARAPSPLAVSLAVCRQQGWGYGQRPVPWTIGKAGKPAPNRAARRRLKKKQQRWLRTHKKKHPELSSVAAKLASCGHKRMQDRCGHPACAWCAGAVQSLMVGVAYAFVLKQSARAPWKTLSVILPPCDPAGEIDFKAEHERYEDLLRQARVSLGMFGLDFSYNEDQRWQLAKEERFDPHACVHLWGLAPAAQVDAAYRLLTKMLRPTCAVPRPIKRQHFNGNPAAIAYAFKPDFTRRETILQCRSGSNVLVRNTRKRPLRVEQAVQLILALDQAEPSDRIILLGVKLVITGSRPRLSRC